MIKDKTPEYIRIDERNHVEKPRSEQLQGLGWTVLDFDQKQKASDTYRQSFAEVIMEPVLRDQLKIINPWLAEDQLDEVIRQLTANFTQTSLLENNRQVFDLLLENSSVSENRKTREKSPTYASLTLLIPRKIASSPSANTRSEFSVWSTISFPTSYCLSMAYRSL